MTAGGPTENRDTTMPPLRDEATYIIYGQTCLAGVRPELVAQRVEIHKPDKIGMMGIIALTGRYGDMPVQVINGSAIASIETVASSE